MVEPLGAGVLQLAYSIERVAFAATFVRGFVPYSATCDVETAVRRPSDVDGGASHPADMIEVGRQPGPTRLGQIRGLGGSLPSTMLITMRPPKPRAAAQARTGVANRSENPAAERVLNNRETLDTRPRHCT